MVIVFTTVSDAVQAAALSTGLLEARLAGCVQELAINSRYRWEGEIHNDPEVLLLIKTTKDREDDVVSFLEAEHPYDVPEIAVVAADRVAEGYLGWLVTETRPIDKG